MGDSSSSSETGVPARKSLEMPAGGRPGAGGTGSGAGSSAPPRPPPSPVPPASQQKSGGCCTIQ
eukprot:CAMPEP_0182445048 /NCGR_PEP_ID=MMETSP1172-20130603/3305_1 /TAXON_ID=708627 /ORGANISM="Timspurckia oligopyrenoides, Strain CCMP3278" /LENGTH=63 /DNA_ID=CAMNT_0024640745 /DNA_START=239 /DNA_END=430 /DNA_ORIENTATION=-